MREHDETQEPGPVTSQTFTSVFRTSKHGTSIGPALQADHSHETCAGGRVMSGMTSATTVGVVACGDA